jgi:hypothetical protein
MNRLALLPDGSFVCPDLVRAVVVQGDGAGPWSVSVEYGSTPCEMFEISAKDEKGARKLAAAIVEVLKTWGNQ